jgi:hypothetical protein
MNKIDFFGGTHGNFLELMLNLFVYQIKFDQTQSFFNENGACHLKNKASSYEPMIKQYHYSFFNEKFNPDDLVIEIHCSPSDMLAAVTNSFLRSGDQKLDLYNLHIDTINKLRSMPKALKFLNNLLDQHGAQEHYSKIIIRNYFYSMFAVPEFGIDMFNTFKHTGQKYIFPFYAFFDIEDFFLNLNLCAFFLNQDFYPNDNCVSIWKEFIEHNQGYHSQLRCKKILKAILSKSSMKIDKLNLIEEAWIIHMIAQIFRCYDHPIFFTEDFPSDTIEISNKIYNWKLHNYLA